jgi:hypothetical protein
LQFELHGKEQSYRVELQQVTGSQWTVRSERGGR